MKIINNDKQITLPIFHPGQVKAYNSMSRFYALRCGRRWGKSEFLKTIAADDFINGKYVAWIGIEHKFNSEVSMELNDMLAPIISSSNKNEGVIRSITGGRIDFWVSTNDRACRSRKYHTIIIDEAAHANEDLLHIYNTSIEPSLKDYRGRCIVASTPNGIDQQQFFWRCCNDPKMNFTEFHAPTVDNPYIPIDEMERTKRQTDPIVYQQEYEAMFINWQGVSLFKIENCLVDGKPINYPKIVDTLFFTMDTALKEGTKNDCTGVVYWSYTEHPQPSLVCLDYDMIRIEGDLLENWVPNCYQHLDELAKKMKVRYGIKGGYIEDIAGGHILINQLKRKNIYPVYAINPKIIQKGKELRAVNASSYMYQGLVKLSENAYNKTIELNGPPMNHLLSQVFGFVLGDEKAKTRADDLLDCWTAGVAVSLGNNQGF